MNAHGRYADLGEDDIESGGEAEGRDIVKFLLIGAGIGAALALLFAPMSGRELRDTIRQGCRNAFDGITEQTRTLRVHGSNLLGFRGRKTASGEYDPGDGI